MWDKLKPERLWQTLYAAVGVSIAGCVYLCWTAAASDAQGALIWIVGLPVIIALDLLLVWVSRKVIQAHSSSTRKWTVYLVALFFVGLPWIGGASLSLAIFERIHHKSPMQYARDDRGPGAHISLGPGAEVKFDRNRFRLLPCDVIDHQKRFSWDVGDDYSKFDISFENLSDDVKYVNWLSPYMKEGPHLPVHAGQIRRVPQAGSGAQVVRDEKEQCKFIIALKFRHRPPPQLLKFPDNQ